MVNSKGDEISTSERDDQKKLDVVAVSAGCDLGGLAGHENKSWMWWQCVLGVV